MVKWGLNAVCPSGSNAISCPDGSVTFPYRDGVWREPSFPTLPVQLSRCVHGLTRSEACRCRVPGVPGPPRAAHTSPPAAGADPEPGLCVNTAQLPLPLLGAPFRFSLCSNFLLLCRDSPTSGQTLLLSLPLPLLSHPASRRAPCPQGC